jgi:hypothetical protein
MYMIFRFLSRYIFSFSVLVAFSIAGLPRAEATPEREFIMSCTYGVLTGTLVGAASLAFVDKPGENLQHVARGASIGLYMGIALGFYTVYVLPKQLQKEEEKMLENEAGGDSQSHLMNFFVFPIIADSGLEGAGAFWRVTTF